MKNISLGQIVEELKQIEKDERRLEETALEHLSFIARNRHYQKYRCKSLFDFCVEVLGYSKSKASRRSIAVQCLDSLGDKKRKDVLEQMQAGALTLTHLVQAQSVFRQERPDIAKKEEILDKLQNKSTRESERILVQEFGSKVAVKETFRAVSANETKVSLLLDQETLDLLERFKNLSAHENPYGSNALALKLALKAALKVKDPILKVIRVKNTQKSENVTIEGARKKPQETDTVPAPGISTSRVARGNLRALVWKKYKGQCGNIDNKSGRRCLSKYMLEVDHITPVSRGGKTEFSNLRLLCRDHHRLRQ